MKLFLKFKYTLLLYRVSSKNRTTAKFNEQKLNDFHNNNSNLSYVFEIKNFEHMDYADIPYLTRLTGMSVYLVKVNLTKDLNFLF